MFSKHLYCGAALFARLDNRCHKPGEKYSQHQKTVESGKLTVEKQNSRDYGDQHRHGKITFYAVTRALDSRNY
jgi:hypothetical protein